MARRKREYRETWWARSYDYTTMMKVMGARLSRRKRLLFGCATARLVWDFVVRPCNRAAILTSEAYADGRATRDELAAAWRGVEWEAAMYSEWHIGALTAGLPYPDLTDQDRERLDEIDRTPFAVSRMSWADALRDIVGNPFHEVALRTEWLEADGRVAAALAETAYEDHAFDRLPILADALEDAGCDVAPVLDHLRDPGRHFRGCWALDLALGRR